MALPSFSYCPSAPPRRFYVPNRVDIAAMLDEGDHGDDGSDDVAMILEKLRRSEEDQYEEAGLVVWMRSQQEVRWGMLGREGWSVRVRVRREGECARGSGLGFGGRTPTPSHLVIW